jgi:hypothetical protein
VVVTGREAAVTEHANWIPTDIDVERASPARVYDFLLGGGWNFDVDRKMARQAIERMPWVGDLARHNRQFLGRAVRFALRPECGNSLISVRGCRRQGACTR